MPTDFHHELDRLLHPDGKNRLVSVEEFGAACLEAFQRCLATRIDADAMKKSYKDIEPTRRIQ